MVKKCIIDIGSNTIKLYLVDILENGDIKELEVKRKMARLGSKINKTKLLDDKTKITALKHIEEYLNICSEHEVKNENILITATAACRNAKNGIEFINEIKNKYKIPNIKILSGEEEAKFTFLGVLQSIKSNNTNYCIIDVGGGSFQISIGTKENYYGGTSIQKGGNNISEEFLLNKPTTIENVNRAIDCIKNLEINELKIPATPIKLVGAGGTIKIMQLMLRGKDDLTPLKIEEVENTAYMLAPLDAQQRFEWFKNKYPNKKTRLDTGLTENRAEVFLAGLCIIAGLMLKLSTNELIFSITDAKDYIIKLDKLD